MTATGASTSPLVGSPWPVTGEFGGQLAGRGIATSPFDLVVGSFVSSKGTSRESLPLGPRGAAFMADPVRYVVRQPNSMTDARLLGGPAFTVPQLVPIADQSTVPVWAEGALRHWERIEFLGSMCGPDLPALDDVARQSARSLVLALYRTVPEELRQKVNDAFITCIYEGELQVEWEGPDVYIEVEVRRDRRFRLYARIFGNRWTTEVRSPVGAAEAVSTLLNFLT